MPKPQQQEQEPELELQVVPTNLQSVKATAAQTPMAIVMKNAVGTNLPAMERTESPEYRRQF